MKASKRKAGKNNTPLRTALIYAVFGVLWILISDRVVETRFPLFSSEYVSIQTIKGWLFVLASASLIYLILRSDMKSLRESEERYRLLFDSSVDAILLTVPNGDILAANPAACRMFERTEEEIIRIGRNGLVDPSDPRLALALEERNRSGNFIGELTLLRKSGEKFPGEISTSMFEDKHGQLKTSMIVRDITERRQVESALHEAQQNLNIMFDTMSEGIALNEMIYDENGEMIDYRILSVNEAFYSIADYGSELVVGNVATRLYGMSAEFIKSFWMTHREKTSTAYTEMWSPLNNKCFFVATSPFVDNKFVTSFFDITERKQAEAKVSHLNRLYATISQINQVIVRAKDRSFLFSEICRIANEYGKFRMAWIGMIDEADGFVKAVVFAGEEQGYLADINISISDPKLSSGPTGSAIREGRCIICQDIATDPRMESWRESALQRGYRSSAAVPILQKGHPIGALTVYSPEPRGFTDEDQHLLDEIGQDISYALDTMDAEAERLQAQEALRQSEHRFRSLIENSLDNISLLAMDGTLLWESPATIRTLGYEEDAFKGKNILELIHPDDLEWVGGQFNEMLEMPRMPFQGTFRVRHADGSWRWIESIGANLLNDPSVKAIVINYRDITEKKAAEDALHLSQQQLRSMIEEAPLSIAMFDREMKYIAASHRWVRENNDVDANFIGHSHYKMHPNIPERWREIHRRGIAGETLSNDDDLWIDESGKKQWLRWAVVPWHDAHGEIGGIILSMENITDRKFSEEALKASEEKYRDLVENSQNLICTHDMGGNLLSVNEAAVLISGYSREALLKMNLKDVLAGDKAKRQFDAYIKRIKADGQAQGMMDVRMANGEIRTWAFNNTLRTQGVEKPIVRGSARDVTERKRAEDALRESEERFHKSFHSSPVGMDITTSDGKFIDVNDAFSEIVGYGREEILGHTSLELKIVTPEQREIYTRQVREEGHVYNQEFTLRHKSGEIRVVLGSMEVIELNGQPCVLSTAIDITNRKQAELELVETKILLERTFASLDEAIFVVSHSNRKVLACNPVVEKMFGYKDEELIGRTTEFMYVSTAEYEEYPQKLSAALDAHGVFHGELQMRRRDGTTFPAEITETRILDGMGNYAGVVSVIRDITRRKQAEGLLKQSEQRYRLLFEDMPIAIWEEDLSQVRKYLDALKEQGVEDFHSHFTEHPEAAIECANMFKILDANQSAVIMYRAKSKEELIKDTNEHMSQGEAQQRREILLALASGSVGGSWEGPEETMTGELIEVNLNWAIEPGHEQDYSRVIVTTIDVTERKRAARREQKKTQTLELLARGATLSIVLEAIVSIVETDLVDSVCSILLLDDSKTHLLHGAAPHLPEFYNQAIDGQPIGMGQGSCGTAAFTGQRVIVKDIETHPYWENYRDVARQAGLRSCWSQPILSSSGEVLGTFAVYHQRPTAPGPAELETILNVTSLASITIERKRAEQTIREYAMSLERRVEQRTAELVAANRTKDEFLANMSHELRTPLNSVLGFSETLLEGVRGPLDERQSQAVEMIRSSGEHLLGLINDILDVSKIDAGKFEIRTELVDVDDICRSSLTFIKQLANKKSITVEYSAPPDSKISVDPKRLKQILVNLLNNAVKFTPEKGKVSLEVLADEKQKQMRFSVSDTGIGIVADDLPKLFKPFVQLDSSLARQYEGSGLGLMLVKQLTEMHDGTVQVHSEVGQGSRFTVILPWYEKENSMDGVLFVAEKERKKNVQMSLSTPIPINGIKILLAEDNETNVMMVKDYLENHGYQIFVTHDGAEALEKAAEISPHLILMDIQMPHMDGLEAIRRLRATPRFAAVPIIALTAFAMPGDRERCLEAGVNEYMSKPVSLKKLLDLISELVEK